MNSAFDASAFLDPAWLRGQGPDADLVISTRASLSRNLAGFAFPNHLATPELETVYRELAEVLAGGRFFPPGALHLLADMTRDQHKLLRELHLLDSTRVAPARWLGLVMDQGGTLAALVNGEDHLRLTGFVPGFAPRQAAEPARRAEEELERELAFSYREDLGYLTASPTSVGTGLKLAAFLHLPGLVLADEIDKILNALRQLRFSIRGLFDQGSTVRGAVFQVSNVVTLGRDEEEIVTDFSYHVQKVLEHERSARRQLYARDRLWLEDLVHRSLAVLRSARMITSQETFDLLSNIRLGAGLGILPGLAPGLLNKALFGQQTGHLQASSAEPLSGNARAIARASFLRELFES